MSFMFHSGCSLLLLKNTRIVECCMHVCVQCCEHTSFVWEFLCFLNKFSPMHICILCTFLFYYIYMNDALYIFVLLFISSLARTSFD